LPKYTEKKAKAILEILSNENGIIETVASIGNGLPKFYNTLIPLSQAKDVAQVHIKLDLKKVLDEFGEISEYNSYLKNKLVKNVSGVDISINQLEQGEPIGSPVVLIVSSDELENLAYYSELIKVRLGITICHGVDVLELRSMVQNQNSAVIVDIS